MTVEVSYLDVIPPLGFSAGYSVYNTYKDGRTLQFEPSYIPESADTYEQGLAFLAFAVGRNEERHFGNVPEWYSDGKEHRQLLPWEMERKRERDEYDALPKVSIDIEWMRVLVKMLKGWKQIPSQEIISLSYNGQFLSFEFGEHHIPIPGNGKAWENRYSIDPSFLNDLPKRITKRNLILLVRNNQLQFGNRCYDLLHVQAI